MILLLQIVSLALLSGQGLTKQLPLNEVNHDQNTDSLAQGKFDGQTDEDLGTLTDNISQDSFFHTLFSFNKNIETELNLNPSQGVEESIEFEEIGRKKDKKCKDGKKDKDHKCKKDMQNSTKPSFEEEFNSAYVNSHLEDPALEFEANSNYVSELNLNPSQGVEESIEFEEIGRKKDKKCKDGKKDKDHKCKKDMQNSTKPSFEEEFNSAYVNSHLEDPALEFEANSNYVSELNLNPSQGVEESIEFEEIGRKKDKKCKDGKKDKYHKCKKDMQNSTKPSFEEEFNSANVDFHLEEPVLEFEANSNYVPELHLNSNVEIEKSMAFEEIERKKDKKCKDGKKNKDKKCKKDKQNSTEISQNQSGIENDFYETVSEIQINDPSMHTEPSFQENFNSVHANFHLEDQALGSESNSNYDNFVDELSFNLPPEHAFSDENIRFEDEANQRIIGGSTARQGAYPYQVSLRTGNFHFCGGSIIAPQWIVTAAHCTIGRRAGSFSVIAGTNSLSTGGISYATIRVINHPYYNPKVIKHDVCVTKVNRRFDFSNNIKYINLPSSNIGDNEPVVLSGWGYTWYDTKNDRGTTPDALQQLDMHSVNIKACQSALSHMGDIAAVIDASQLCAYSGRQGVGGCKGDSGGPLLRNRELAAIVSWGYPCALGYPDVFTRVFAYKLWIIQTVQRYGE